MSPSEKGGKEDSKEEEAVALVNLARFVLELSASVHVAGEELGADEKKSDKNEYDEACIRRLLEKIGAHVDCNAQQLLGEGGAGQRDSTTVSRL